MLNVTRRMFTGGLLTSLAARPTRAAPAPVLLLVDLYVAGDAYYQIAQAAPDLTVGSALVLRREPDHPHDPLAVAVHSLQGLKLGYLPRHRNEAAARLIDAGARVTATITQGSPDPWPRLRYDLRLG